MIDGLLGRSDLHVRADHLLIAHRPTDPIAALVIEVGSLSRLRTARRSPSAGERLARRIAAIRDELREPLDILARRGDRKLVAILSRTSLAEAITVGERIRRVVEASEVPVPTAPGETLGLKIGAASITAGVLEHLDDLIDAAETALRDTGIDVRDRIVRASGENPAPIDDLTWA